MYTTVQQYLSQYKNVNLSTKKKWKEKYNNSTTMCIPVQKCKFQYKNKSFGTEKYFLKNWKKPVGTLYMIITMYLNIYAYYSIPKQTLYTSLLYYRLYNTKLPWPTTAIHKYILYYSILYLSTQTYSLAVRVYLPVQ